MMFLIRTVSTSTLMSVSMTAKRLAHAGGVIRPERNDQVGFRRLLAPVFAFVVKTRHDRVAGSEVQQDSGQRQIERVVTALALQPLVVELWAVPSSGIFSLARLWFRPVPSTLGQQELETRQEAGPCRNAARPFKHGGRSCSSFGISYDSGSSSPSAHSVICSMRSRASKSS